MHSQDPNSIQFPYQGFISEQPKHLSCGRLIFTKTLFETHKSPNSELIFTKAISHGSTVRQGLFVINFI
jgi:hypothetical protein